MKKLALLLALFLLPSIPIYSQVRRGGTNLSIEQNGTLLTSSPIALNFGAGMSCSLAGGVVTCTSTGGATTFYQTFQNATSALTQRNTVNFTAGITCTDNAGASRTDCTLKDFGATANQWVSSVVSGSMVTTQPNFTNLAGNIAVNQMASGTGASASTCFFGDNSWKTCGGGGGSAAGSQYALQYNGGAGVFAGINVPTTPSNVTQLLCNTNSSGAAAASVFCLAGVPTNAQTGTSYTIAATDRASYVSFSNASPIAVSLPSAASLGSNFAFATCNIGSGTATITPATSTISYANGNAYTSGASSLALATGQCATVRSDNTNYFSVVQALATVATSGSFLDLTNRKFSCQTGLGDGNNFVPAGTYLQSFCWNKTGLTVTLSGLQCYTDNVGSSTMNATNGTGTALLTGAVTCSSPIASGTQSGTTTIANNDFIKFTFVADGTSKQTTWVITGTY